LRKLIIDLIGGPACGTGGFLLIAHEHVMADNPVLDPDQLKRLPEEALRASTSETSPTGYA